MIQIIAKCRKHPTYQGIRKPTARWYAWEARDRICLGCQMIFALRNTHGSVELTPPWVKFHVVGAVGRAR